MKKSIVLAAALLCLGFSGNSGFAQVEEVKEGKTEERAYKNALKIAPFSLLAGKANIAYERAIGKNTSINLGMGGSYLPGAMVAFSGRLDGASSLDRGSYSFVSIRPELRFYTGGKGIQKGFYIGPYMNMSRYAADLFSEVTTTAGVPSSIAMEGSFVSVGGGLQMGTKFRLGKRAFIDWSFLSFGANVHSLEMNYSGTGSGVTAGDYGIYGDFLYYINNIPFLADKVEAIEEANSLQFKLPALLPAFRSSLTLGIAF